MKKTERLDMLKAQKITLFKRGLPNFIIRYIKQEKPEGLLPKSIAPKSTVAAITTADQPKCLGCGSTQHFLVNCPYLPPIKYKDGPTTEYSNGTTESGEHTYPRVWILWHPRSLHDDLQEV